MEFELSVNCIARAQPVPSFTASASPCSVGSILRAATDETVPAPCDPDPTSVNIRPLERADAPTLAKLHLTAFPGFFLSELGASFLELYYRRIAETPSAVCAVAVDAAGAPVGFVAGALDPRGFYRRLLMRDWLAFGVRALPAAVRRPARIRRLVRAIRHPGANPAGEGVAGLFSLAVDPAAQGRSVGRLLVERFLEVAAARGASSVYLTTDAAENERVNRFYERCGFQVARTFTTPEGRVMNEYWCHLAR
jgi:ribosomal protein S18 acetylase RimI-like enzyme